ncbi:MAG: hypothetical protein ABI835_05080, partial [Chloroflexota bacterium]
MAYTLERIIYGAPDASSEMGILAISDHLTPQDASLWRGITSLRPMDAPGFKASSAYGIFAGPGSRFVLACAYSGANGKPLYEYVVLPRDLLSELAGNLAPLLALFSTLYDAPPNAMRVAPFKLESAPRWTPVERRSQIDSLLATGIDMPQAITLLGAVLHERGLMICDFPGDTETRLKMIQGFMALLPAPARPDLTFSTHRHEKTMTQARVVFAPNSTVTGRWIANWQARSFPEDESTLSPFIRRLLALWKGDIPTFLSAIDQMDTIGTSLMANRNLQSSLTVMAERHALDAQILAGEDASPEALKAVMKDIPPEGELKRQYARRLLLHALAARDADAALIVARTMDEDPELDQTLYKQIERELYKRPDAVYSFVRARLGAVSTGGDLTQGSERWAERLKVAALTSLRVAIRDGDAETTINWLRLVAREPASYGLGEIVRNGILAAQERAQNEPELAQALILLAVKRDQAALETLLANDALLAAVPNGLGRALRRGEGDSAFLLQTYGVEVFLVALTRALGTHTPDLFTVETVEQVWAIYTSGSATTSVERIIGELSTSGATWLAAPALETLLGLMLRDKRDDLSYQVIHQVSQRDDFLAVLVSAISQSERGDSESLALIAHLIAVGDLTQQDALDVYVGLLIAWDWRKDALEFMEQVARAMQQHSTLDIQPDVVWHLLAVAAELKQEFITRVAVRRLTVDFEALEDDGLLADDLQRLTTLIAWSSGARAQLLAWWRAYVHEQSTARLQRIDKVLADTATESRHTLDDLRTIVQAIIAFRRMLGKRSLSQFAEDVSTAYAILQGMAESFDPTARRATSFDPATIRLVMDARAEELSPHELKILANNFKELAQLVTTMADNRSKATLIRRGDDVDRQLMTGEQQPHSAVDVLKWMAGYLSGTQEKPEDSAEMATFDSAWQKKQ